MGRCREWCRGADEPEFAKHALLEIRKSSALSRAPAGPRDRDAANDTEIEFRHVLKPDRLPMLHEPSRGRGGLEIYALRRELVGIDTQVRKTLAQIGNRREQELAVVKCAQRIGICGGSGLHLTMRARRHSSSSLSRLAATKFGMRSKTGPTLT